MKRLLINKRANWQKEFENLGFTFHSVGGEYWKEGVCYEFSSKEIDHLEAVTAEVDSLCLGAVEHIIKNDLFDRLSIPASFANLAKRSWEQDDKSIYGRFDFSYDGRNEPRLLEYNADTPTSLVESSIAQWLWLEQIMPKADQFNSIHEKLLDAFGNIKNILPIVAVLYFTCVKDHNEDFVTVEYLRDVASQVGIKTSHIFIEDIGYSAENDLFCDLDNKSIEYLFKLYPWEWIINDEFGKHLLNERIKLFEPPWKMILSNKGILPVLWELYPEHPNLLPAYFEEGMFNGDYVKKPLFSREGANIILKSGGNSYSGTKDGYGGEGFIFQKTHILPNFDGAYPVIGSWLINQLPAGIGIREDNSPITTNSSAFVPHYFDN